MNRIEEIVGRDHSTTPLDSAPGWANRYAKRVAASVLREFVAEVERKAEFASEESLERVVSIAALCELAEEWTR